MLENYLYFVNFMDALVYPLVCLKHASKTLLLWLQIYKNVKWAPSIRMGGG